MSERKESIKMQMERLHHQSWPILTSLREADLQRPVYTEEAAGWTVKDVLGHLADAERGLLDQVQRLAAGEVTVPDDFDLDRWNRSVARKHSAVETDQLLQDIESAYRQALDFLEILDDELLDLRGRHPSGDLLSAEGFFLRMARHRAQHAADILSSLQQ